MSTAADSLAGGGVQLLMNAAEVAKALNVSERSIWRLLSAGKMPRPVRIGGSTRFRVRDIENWIDAGCPTVGAGED